MGVLDNLFGKTLYYPGCVTHCKLPEVEEKYKEILMKLNINYVVLNDLKCCGVPLLNAGYRKDFEELKDENFKILKKNKIKRVIVNCPECYHFFKEEYGLKVVHITQLLAKNKEKIKAGEEKEAFYHDPCYFARYSNVTEEPRSVLEKANVKGKELPKNRKNTLCCGAGGNMKVNVPEQANKVAKLRLSKVDKLITQCPHCYVHFLENAEDKEIVDLSEVIEL